MLFNFHFFSTKLLILAKQNLHNKQKVTTQRVFSLHPWLPLILPVILNNRQTQWQLLNLFFKKWQALQPHNMTCNIFYSFFERALIKVIQHKMHTRRHSQIIIITLYFKMKILSTRAFYFNSALKIKRNWLGSCKSYQANACTTWKL